MMWTSDITILFQSSFGVRDSDIGYSKVSLRRNYLCHDIESVFGYIVISLKSLCTEKERKNIGYMNTKTLAASRDVIPRMRFEMFPSRLKISA